LPSSLLVILLSMIARMRLLLNSSEVMDY
jgi:hypothetical protein